MSLSWRGKEKKEKEKEKEKTKVPEICVQRLKYIFLDKKFKKVVK